MPATFQVSIMRGRTETVTVALTEGDGTTSTTIGGSDNVRAKVYRRDDQTPDLEIESAEATANGSVVTVVETGPDPAAQVTIKFAQADTDGLLPGHYTLEIFVVDDSDSDAAIGGAIGVLNILSSGGGDIAL